MSKVALVRFVTVSLVLAVMGASGSSAFAEVPWVTDLQRARRDALQLNQPVLLDFWAAWCGPCNAMDVEVFSQERVATAMRRVLPVRVNIDRHQDMARKYNVGGTPTLIVTDGHGNELFRHGGVLTVDQLVAVLEALPADVSRINALAGSLAADKNNVTALRALGDELRQSGFFLASSECYRRGLKTGIGRERTEQRSAMLVALGRNQAVLRAFKDAEKTLSQFLNEFPGHPEAAAVRDELAAIRKER